MNSTVTPSTMLPVPYNLGELHKSIISLDDDVASLAGYLSPVLKPEGLAVPNAATVTPVDPPESEVARALRHMTDKVEAIRRQVESVKSHLEV